MILSSKVKKKSKLREFLQEEFEFSSRLLTQLRKNRAVFVNGQYRYMDYPLEVGDEIQVKLDFDKNTFEIEEGPVEVVYEDQAMIVVNKDPYLAVHPTRGTPSGTLLNLLGYYAKEQGEDYKIRFANRLDRDTSGLIIIAKNKYIDQRLSKQFARRSPEKFYLALVEGKTEDSFSFSGPMGRRGEDFARSIMDGGKDSLTNFETVKRGKDWSLVSCRPVTGRTHQLRLHLSHLGHPILGDELYGYEGQVERTMLHCERMVFEHPLSGELLDLRAPLKEDMVKVLEALDE